MSNAAAFTGLIISGIVAVLFLADLAVAFPFSRVSVVGDIGFIVSAALLGYLSWSVREKSRRVQQPAVPRPPRKKQSA